jgi:thioredoxin-related protein
MSVYIKSKYPELEVKELDARNPANSELVMKYNVISVPTVVDVETGNSLIGFRPDRLDDFLFIHKYIKVK